MRLLPLLLVGIALAAPATDNVKREHSLAHGMDLVLSLL
jgi:hypothetical protein